MLVLLRPTAGFSIGVLQTQPGFAVMPSSSALSAHSLTTCLESLSEERRREETAYRCLEWLDLANNESSDKHTKSEMSLLPLYPVGAVYLPTNDAINHTLNNVEPQNIQMAKDLLRNSSDDNPPRFCAVLRALDTGRIASTATIMRIVDAEEQFHYGTEDIARIKLTCYAEKLVTICSVKNGAGWSQKRLTKSSEYLVAKACPFVENESSEEIQQLTVKERLWALVKDLRTIKTMYQLDLGAEEFPPGSLPKIGDGIQDTCIGAAEEEISLKDLDASFWRLAQEWQSVCYTLRQGQQTMLSAERNERMVEAACAKGGPLKLPIHMSDLEPQERQEIQQMETKAQERHIELGIDPVLDFQVMLSLPNLNERIEWLNKITKREQRRLAKAASLQYSK